MKNKFPNQYKFLDEEEKDLIESVERGEWRSIMTPELKKHYEEVARNTPTDYHGEAKDAEVFMLEDDIIKKLKTKAKKQGIPYKDLAVSVLQKFANS